jgi:hypothetical protein
MVSSARGNGHVLAVLDILYSQEGERELAVGLQFETSTYPFP